MEAIITDKQVLKILLDKGLKKECYTKCTTRKHYKHCRLAIKIKDSKFSTWLDVYDPYRGEMRTIYGIDNIDIDSIDINKFIDDTLNLAKVYSRAISKQEKTMELHADKYASK